MKNNRVIFVTTDQKWKAKISGVKVHFQQLQFLAGRKIQKIRYINYIGLGVGTSDGSDTYPKSEFWIYRSVIQKWFF